MSIAMPNSEPILMEWAPRIRELRNRTQAEVAKVVVGMEKAIANRMKRP